MQDDSTEKQEMLRDFAWRLNSSAEKAKLRQVDIAARLGATAARVGNWFQGLNFPRKREREQLASLLGVSEAWLIEGKTETDDVPVIPAIRGTTEVREVPVISWTHAGVAASYEEMPKHWHGKVASTSRDRRAFALAIEGESMLPDFKPSDRVVLEPLSQPRSGKPVVAKFHDDESVQLRIYTKLPDGRIRLASLRPEIYPTLDYEPSAFDWIYPVRELVRTVY